MDTTRGNEYSCCRVFLRATSIYISSIFSSIRIWFREILVLSYVIVRVCATDYLIWSAFLSVTPRSAHVCHPISPDLLSNLLQNCCSLSFSFSACLG